MESVIGWVVAETSTDEDGWEHRVLECGVVYADRGKAEAEVEYLDSLGLSRSYRVLALLDGWDIDSLRAVESLPDNPTYRPADAEALLNSARNLQRALEDDR